MPAPPLSISAVEPASAGSAEPVSVRVLGTFPARVYMDFVDPANSRVEDAFVVRIGTAAVEQVVLGSDGALTGQLPPGLAPGTYDVVVLAQDGRSATLAGGFTVLEAGAAVRLQFDPISSPQPQALPFAVRISAVDGSGNVVTSFSGSAVLTISPASTLACATGCASGLTTGAFVAGVWSGSVSIREIGASRTLTATAGALSGTSNPFDVRMRTPPTLAWPSWTPTGVNPGGTVAFDASLAADRESPAEQLEVSWDFQSSVLHEDAPPGASPWTSFTTTKTTQFTYGSSGLKWLRVAIRDPDGDIGYAELHSVGVVAAPDLCVVTTLSAADDGASDCAGASGTDGALSFPEAIRLSNSLAGTQTIAFALPAGVPQPKISCAGACPATLSLSAPVTLLGETVGAWPVQLSGWNWSIASTGVFVADVQITREGTDSSQVTVLPGADATFRRATLRDLDGLVVSGSATLEDVHVRRCTGICITVDGAGASLSMLGGEIASGFSGTSLTVGGISLRNCGSGGTVLDVQGAVFLQTGATGIDADATCTRPIRVLNDTFHLVETPLSIAAGGGHVVADSIFTSSATAAASCGTATFGERRRNVLFGNASDGCLAGDSGNLTTDPEYVDPAPATADLRLQLTSPAKDASTDRGTDLNGVGPGLFSSNAPDRGGRETW